MCNEKYLIEYNIQVPSNKTEIKGRIPICNSYSEKEIFDNIKFFNEKKTNEMFIVYSTKIKHRKKKYHQTM